MTKHAIIMLTILVAGCASQPLVNIPIPIPPPKAPVVERPHIYLLDVPDEAFVACGESSERCGEVMSAYEATVESLLGWGREMETLLKVYQ